MNLLDLVVAMGLLMMLLAGLFAVFFSGGKAWRKTDDRYELLHNTQNVLAQVSREAERSTVFSVSIIPGRAVSFLSPMNDSGNFVTDTLGDERWERYLVFYHDPVKQEVRMVDVPLLPGSFERRTPQPIERFISLSGQRPLSTYCVGGKLLGRRITSFEPDQPASTKRLTLRVHTVQPSSTQSPDLQLDIATDALMRN
ncbi:hypothetical protein JST97_09560 [bacterium]|nr:hypothetical protein [bacterium]